MGGTATDRCDVGVYNSGSPPQVLALSGNLATHDPSAIESNGTYYEFQTGLDAKTSTNSTTWNAAGTPFGTPAWMSTAVPGVQGLWAPDISLFGGQYHLYYAGSYPFGANTSCIGHATRAAMNAGSWTDQGSSIVCSSSANNWNAIDPNLIVDTAGVPWLVFGSWWSGIQIVQLNAQGTARANSTVTLIAGRGGKGIEGPFMVRRCGYYYLLTSWDACCQGFKSTYNIRVGRSTNVNSGFVDKDGVALTAGGGTLLVTGNGTTFNGPGGQSVMIAGTKAFLVYHAYAPNSVVGGSATLRIADLVWDSSGWPVPVGP
jgi:arabinan endo-1,5-alpha-L-arabinosidase